MVMVSCQVMIFSPVAMGEEAFALNEKNIKNSLLDMGFGHKQTLGEFYQKNKKYYPEFVRADLEKFVSQNQNLQMPDFVVSATQSTMGEVIPVITFTENGKTSRIQIYGEKNKWMKMNGLSFSESDINRVEDVYTRFSASDINLKRKADLYFKNTSKQKNTQLTAAQSDLARFQGFPRVTPQLWKSLSVEQRAAYLTNMRLLWQNAKRVLEVMPENYSQFEPIDDDVQFSKIEKYRRIIFGDFAFAKPGIKTPTADVAVKGTTVRTADGKIVSIPYDAKSCVVAGYIGAYDKVSNLNGDNRIGCSVDVAIATYKSNPDLKFVQEANAECASKKSSMVACNPIIYGFPNGNVACIDSRSDEFQKATHFSSQNKKDTCDGMSRLSTSEDIIKLTSKDYSDIQPREKQIAAIEADQKKEGFALTQKYIKGVLTKRDPLFLALLEKGQWNLGLDNELVRIQTQFEQEIERATQACRSEVSSKHEKNQKMACDQLHRRWLFVEKEIASMRSKACMAPARYIGSYDQGESSLADTAKSKTQLNKKTIDEKGTDLCQCPDAKDKKVSFGQECSPPPKTTSLTPEVSKDAPPAKKDETPSEVAEKKNSNWIYWALGGLGLLAAVGLYFKHKNNKSEKVQPPIPAQTCAAPRVGDYPNCVCATGACVPNQQIYNATTCQCTNVPQIPTCADNTPAPHGQLLNCPKCANGSFRTVAGCPVEGGGGNNCPQGGCSGGLPGIGN